MHVLDSMKVRVDRKSLLDTLTVNRAKHQTIVKEARVGYLVKAKEAVSARLKELEAGRPVPLTFALAPPRDHTNVYDTAIRMMEIHLDEAIVLDSEQVRHLIMDEWDWSSQFLASNAVYSGTARALLQGSDP